MNDYYSEFPQPTLETRIEDAINGVPTYLKVTISKNKLYSLAKEVVSKGREFSLTGYRMFGLAENVQMLIEAIEVERKSGSKFFPCFS